MGRPAVLMCFLPACFGNIRYDPAGSGNAWHNRAGCRHFRGGGGGAVSPAVIVPKMLTLLEEGYGTGKSIPQLILAGASVDDIFVIVMFSAFTGLAQGGTISPVSFLRIPLSILSGILMGIVIGYGLARYFGKIHMRDTAKVLLLLSIAFLLVSAEDRFTDIIPFSALIAVMCIGISLKEKGRP